MVPVAAAGPGTGAAVRNYCQGAIPGGDDGNSSLGAAVARCLAQSTIKNYLAAVLHLHVEEGQGLQTWG